ncbi:hypothetical protein GCM10025864_44600 [Luteimicrobium album]|uniref:Uncharacterized protein n=1 Tax=Luteimicrobium album TaxID=1054550 RepID=A0ABQ6HVB8_9MICO|nr:hypothetical protein [Luteimicrobium album]GMA22295.1 hypothetical protein GCM10025864_00540 [Luteimicrobium album]GMA26701.1 hypothetical protein GCM10025864_44600 [Luteimicrobium album]
MQTDPRQGFTGLPDYNDPPKVPDHLSGLFSFLLDRSTEQYPTLTALQSAIPSPADGMFKAVTGEKALYYAIGGQWLLVWKSTPAVFGRRFQNSVAGQSIPSGTDTLYTFAGATGSELSGGVTLGTGSQVGCLIVPKGLWSLSAQAAFPSNATGVRSLYLSVVNSDGSFGANVALAQVKSSGSVDSLNVSSVYRASTGGMAFGIRLGQNSGSALTIASAYYSPFLTAVKIAD